MIELLIKLALTERFFTLCLTLAVCVAGIWCVTTISADSFPDVSNVQVQIITEPENLATEEVESLVTIPIESILNGLPNIKKVRSNSSFGLSVVTAIFDDSTDVYFDRQLVLQRLNGLQLAQDIAKPQLGPLVSSFSIVYMYYLQSEKHNLIELRTIQDWLIAKQLLTVPGVGNVVSYGGFVKQYQVLVAPDKLKGYGLTLDEVNRAITKNNMNAGGNFIEQSSEEIIIRGLGRIDNVADINDIVLKAVGGIPVKISNVATVVIGPAFRRGSASMNGKGEVVTGVVMTRKGANSKEVIGRVESKIQEIEKLLPDGVKIVPYYNQGQLVDSTAETVREILYLSGALVIVILAAILLDIPAALIAAVIIPLSLLFSFIMMKFTGLSANLMTLGAVDFGVVVDAGVVMVENIFRNLAAARTDATKAGETKIDTLPIILTSAQEVGRPIAFAIFIIMSVYLPLFTLEGVEGKMFHPLALTFLYAILGALITALMIIPVLCFWFMKNPAAERHNPALAVLRQYYGAALEVSMKHPRTVLLAAVAGLGLSIILIPFLGSEFMPSLDEGSLLLRTKLAPSVSHTESRRVAAIVEQILCKFPEVTLAVTHIGRSGMGGDLEGVDNADVYIGLTPKSTWTIKNKEQLVDRMAAELHKVPGVIYSFSQPIADMVDDLIAGIKCDVAIKVFGDDPVISDRIASEIEKAIQNIPGTGDLSREQILGLPQLNIKLNREVIARYGLNVSDIQEFIQTALAGKVVSEVIEGSKRFGVLVRFPYDRRDTEEDIQNMLVVTPSGARIPLKQLATIGTKRGLVMINREQQHRRTAVLINIRGRDMGGYVQDAQKAVAEKVQIPKGYWLVWGGQFENQQRAMSRLCIVVPIVLFLIFLLLFATFNSFKHSGLVMLNVPFSIIGGIVALWLTRIPLSVPALVGFIALFGVAVQNGVIMVSYIMQLEKEGLPVEAAIKQGAMVRLRPVFMTALVAIMGLLPKLFSTGTGAEIQRPLATVVFGGLLSATILTLLVLPAVYQLISKTKSVDQG